MLNAAKGAGRRLSPLFHRLAPIAVLLVLTSAAGATQPTVSVSIASPSNGQTLSGSVPLQANASGSISRVDFAVDGTVAVSDSSGPYNGTLDTTHLSNGTHVLLVTAYGKGRFTATASVTFSVSNAAPAPPAPPAPPLAVATASPSNGATVSGQVTWQANVTSGTASKVDFSVDGANQATDTTAPYVYTLDTTTLANGSHNLTVTATASDGTTAASTVGVSVSNAAPLPAAPTATVLPSINGAAQVGQQLTASTGTWNSSPASYAYQWQGCDAGGAACSAIAGATASKYTAVSGDQGHTLRVTVTASNTGGSGSAVSGATSAIQAATPAQPPANLGSGLPARLPMSSGAGGTYYVDGTNGSDTASGSATAPWRTINKALATVPLTGSIINVLPGSYSSVGTSYVINFGRQASVTDPVTLRAQKPGTVLITNGDPNSWTLGGWIHAASGLRIEGLVFRVLGTPNLNKGADALLIENSDRVEVDNCTFNESGTAGPAVRGGLSSGQTADDIWFIDNTFRPSGSDVAAQVSGNGWSSDQYFGTRGSHWIYAGEYGSSTNWDLSNGTRRLVIANNVFTGSTAGDDVQLGPQAQSSYIVNNTFYANHAATVIGTTTGAVYSGSGVMLYANSSIAAYQTGGNLIANNLFVDLDGHGVYGSGPSETGNVVRSNLAYNLRNGSGYEDRTTWDYEPSYEGKVTIFQLGTNVSNSNPLFVNAPGYDFHLRSGSPALGQADPAYTYPWDADGAPRSATPALGAYG